VTAPGRHPTTPPRPLWLDRTAPDHATLCARFRWQVPVRYNIAHDACIRHARRDPDRVALRFEDGDAPAVAYTYEQLRREAARLSNTLVALGVARGDRVAIVLPQRPETGIAYLACFQMGAIAVPLSHLFGADALGFRLRDAGVKVALVDADTLPRVQAATRTIESPVTLIGVADTPPVPGVLRWDRLRERASDAYPCLDTAADDPALVIYTSGTTGDPKGALIPHRALIGNLSGFECSHDFFPQGDDVFWSPADWAWTGGLFDALLPTWHHGRTIVGHRGRFDPERACALMQRHRVRNAFLFPTALKMILKEVGDPRVRFPRLRLRTLMSGGEAVGETVCAWARECLGVHINEIFGQTEMNYVVGGCAAVFAPRAGSMGRPYPGHRIALLDEAGDPVAPGTPGEIAVHRDGDPVMFLGYWNNPEATAAKFTGAWGLTGDLAVQDDDGFLFYRGRTDDVIKTAGYRVGPAEIENCLVAHPAVANAAVIGVPDDTRGQVIRACVVVSTGTSASADLAAQLKDHVRARLAPWQCPRDVVFVDALPMTTTGKVQRRLLRPPVDAAPSPAPLPSAPPPSASASA
jgi:acetyl-CoA synthetase